MKKWRPEERVLRDFYREKVISQPMDQDFSSRNRSRRWIEILATMAAGFLLVLQLGPGFLAQRIKDISPEQSGPVLGIVEIFMEENL